MSALPKPVLRGHIKRKGIKTLIGAFCFAAFNGTLFHFFVSSPRKRAYEDFMRTYDADAHYKDLVNWGYITVDALKNELREG